MESFCLNAKDSLLMMFDGVVHLQLVHFVESLLFYWILDASGKKEYLVAFCISPRNYQHHHYFCPETGRTVQATPPLLETLGRDVLWSLFLGSLHGNPQLEKLCIFPPKLSKVLGYTVLANTLCSISHLNISIYCYIYYIYVLFFIHILSTQNNQIPISVRALVESSFCCGATLPGASSLADSLRRAGIVARDSLHDTVDGSEIRPSPVEVDRLWYYLQSFIRIIPDGAGFQPSTVVLVIHLVISRKFSLVSYDPPYPIIKLGFQSLKEYFAASWRRWLLNL